MKKTLFLFVAILFANVTFSQTSFGVRVGLNSATLSGKESSEDKTDYKAVNGMVFGAVVEQHATDMLSVQFELLYLQKGAQGTGSMTYWGTSFDYTSKIYLNSIELPILLKATFGDNLKFYGNVGPYFNYALGGKYETETVTSNTTETADGKLIFKKEPDNYKGDDNYYDPDEYNRLDWGLYFGGGLGMHLGPGLLSLDIRYGLGFSSFYKDAHFDKVQLDGSTKNIVPDGYEAFKNRNLTISLSYMFGGE